jgi:hypothetical protein
VCVWRGCWLRSREGEIQRAKAKGGLAEDLEKERIERCRDQRQREERDVESGG